MSELRFMSETPALKRNGAAYYGARGLANMRMRTSHRHTIFLNRIYRKTRAPTTTRRWAKRSVQPRD